MANLLPFTTEQYKAAGRKPFPYYYAICDAIAAGMSHDEVAKHCGIGIGRVQWIYQRRMRWRRPSDSAILVCPCCQNFILASCHERVWRVIPYLSPKFSAESPVTADERLGSGGIPTAPPIPRKTEGRINVKGAD